jgi:hypothetical protein
MIVYTTLHYIREIFLCVQKAFTIFMLDFYYLQSDRIFISIKIFPCGDACLSQGMLLDSLSKCSKCNLWSALSVDLVVDCSF